MLDYYFYCYYYNFFSKLCFIYFVDSYSQWQHQQQMTRTCRRSVYLWPAKIPTNLNETKCFHLTKHARVRANERARERGVVAAAEAVAEQQQQSRQRRAEAAQMSFELQRQPKIACARVFVVVVAVVVQHIF